VTAAKECLGIVGVGLIGGSIGLAARRNGRYGPILGVDRDPAVLERAKARGCIDDADELPAVAQHADVIVICTPVDQIASHVLTAARYCRPTALLTDTGSTKVAVVEAVEKELADERWFVGGHPLAGSEKRGPENARADLFDGRVTVLTPTPNTERRASDRAEYFWTLLGSRVGFMSPDEHDRTVALTSHLPHVVAAALAGMLDPAQNGFAASGFRDTTRLAAGDPELWTAILMQNRRPVLRQLDKFQFRLKEFLAALDQSDAATIRRLLTEAKGVRDDLGS
jgi:prephenate dehydrogenase